MQVHRNISSLPEFHNAIVTIGSYDGVHLGHRTVIGKMVEVANSVQGESIVITFHPHPRHLLSSDKIWLLHTLSEKKTHLEILGIDHLVLVPFSQAFADMLPEQYLSDFILKQFSPHTIIIGYDHRFGKNRVGDIQMLKTFAEAHQINVLEITANEIQDIKISSTKIRNALSDGSIQLANQYLGYIYALTGHVVKGDHLGTKLGYPTANIQIKEADKLIPKEGVYAVKILYEDTTYNGMAHIGSRPTLVENDKRIEVHIFDFDQAIYGAELTVQFEQYIRPNQKFNSTHELKEQLGHDKIRIESFFMHVAIVILNYNGREHLQRYLPTVVRHTPEDIRIIVADNASTDDSVQLLQRDFPDVQLIELAENYGFAGGYNQALKQVEADIFILLNSDVEVTPNWTTPLLDAMKDPHLSACQPKVKDCKNKNFFEYAGASGGYIDFLGYPFCRGRVFGVTEEDHGQYDTEQEIFWASGAAMVIRSKLFHDFKGFDATFFAHNEEIDLCWQTKRAGYLIKAIPESVVYHLGGGTLSYDNPNKVYLNFRNNLKMLAKNDLKRNLIWKIPLRLILDGLAGVLFLTEGKYAQIWAILRAHFAFYASIPALIAKRKEIKTILKQHIDKPKVRLKGMYPKSIVWQFYGKRLKYFSQLKKDI